MDEGQTFGGLGYSENDGQTHQQDANSGAGAVAGDMLKQLMQQCLAYHEQQQQEQPQPQLNLPIQGSQNQNYGTKNDLHRDDGPYGFKAGGEERMQELSKKNSNEPGMPQTIIVNNNSHQDPPVGNLQSVVEEGRSRANAILEKFQQLTREHGVVGEVQQKGDTDEAFTAPSEFRKKREKFFEKENERKHNFLLKNLEYVGNRQTQRLQHTLSQLDEAKKYEHQMEGHYRAVIEHRKERLSKSKNMNSEAGIGTAKRQRVECEKTRKGHAPLSNVAPENSLAIYLSGLPTDGSFQEDILHQLFRSYGKIQKIHPYRNKPTGELKGDALVIYQVKKGEEDELLRTVCSQVRTQAILWQYDSM